MNDEWWWRSWILSQKASPNLPHLVHLRRRHHQCGLIAVSGRLGRCRHGVDDVWQLRWKCLTAGWKSWVSPTTMQSEQIDKLRYIQKVAGCITEKVKINVGRWFWGGHVMNPMKETSPWNLTINRNTHWESFKNHDQTLATNRLEQTNEQNFTHQNLKAFQSSSSPLMAPLPSPKKTGKNSLMIPPPNSIFSIFWHFLVQPSPSPSRCHWDLEALPPSFSPLSQPTPLSPKSPHLPWSPEGLAPKRMVT